MKEIQLTQGKVSLVDDDDYEYLMQWKWHAQRSGHKWYARRNFPCPRVPGKYSITMHKQIINHENGLIDHINGDGLDNRSRNLRVCTNSQNQMNRGPISNGSSDYKGVFWHKHTQKWQASITVDSKIIYLGLFKNPKDAAIAYDRAAIKYHGEFSNLNLLVQESPAHEPH